VIGGGDDAGLWVAGFHALDTGPVKIFIIISRARILRYMPMKVVV
jgi:hypothetical protein